MNLFINSFCIPESAKVFSSRIVDSTQLLSDIANIITDYVGGNNNILYRFRETDIFYSKSCNNECI